MEIELAQIFNFKKKENAFDYIFNYKITAIVPRE